MRTDALLQALDAAPAPVRLFVRCDDAGWDHERLRALLDIMDAAMTPIDLAVIPAALDASLAAELGARQDAAPDRLGLHQHGLAHVNHEVEGRRCEFGDARGPEALRRDLHAGRRRLHDLLGGRLDPFFTPPWNRCSAHLPPLLAIGGWRALSRDAHATPQLSLPELPVDADWSRCWRDAAAGGGDPMQRVARSLAGAVPLGRPVGLMLHHAVMDAAEFEALAAALARWTRHPNARWQRMADLLEEVAA